MRVTIFLADDQPVVRHGLRLLFESEPDFLVVGEAGDGLQAVEAVQRLRPLVLVQDLLLPGLEGVEVTRRVLRAWPETRVVILSTVPDLARAAEALDAGAAAYVLKQSTTAELVQAIRLVLTGASYLSPPLSHDDLEQYRQQIKGRLDSYTTLTQREREVLPLVAEGLTSIEIAARLNVSPRTIEMHRSNLMRKLSLSGQAALVRYALLRGLHRRD